MTYDVRVLKTIADCKRVIERAVSAGDKDLEMRVLSRLAEIGGGGHSDPLVTAFFSTLAVYEQTLPKGRANYVRRKLTKLGGGAKAVEQILADWCLDQGMSTGFQHLVDKGLKDQVGEYIVGINFPDRFPPEVVRAARQKLIQQRIVMREEIPAGACDD
jgi:hypothetical protein